MIAIAREPLGGRGHACSWCNAARRPPCAASRARAAATRSFFRI